MVLIDMKLNSIYIYILSDTSLQLNCLLDKSAALFDVTWLTINVIQANGLDRRCAIPLKELCLIQTS